MEFRAMLPTDYKQMKSLWLASPGVRLGAADTAECIAAFLLRNPGMSFVCEVQGAIVGTAMCGHDGRRGFIYHVAVRQDYRGRRIGSGLVERSLAALRAVGIDKCHVFVLADNELGNAFWAKEWGRRRDITLYSRDV